MKTLFLIAGSFLAIAVVQIARADGMTTYNVTENFYAPMAQPNNTIFIGSFAHDSTTQTVSNPMGALTEATPPPQPTLPVPLPESFWLFMAGVMGMFALGNKRKQS